MALQTPYYKWIIKKTEDISKAWFVVVKRYKTVFKLRKKTSSE